MTNISELNDQQLLQIIETGTLPSQLLTHTTQMRICWVLLKKYNVERAIELNNTFVNNHYHNETSFFNTTLSRAYIEIIDDFMKRSKQNDFYKMLKAFPRLKYDFKKIIKTHYGYDVLKEGFKKEQAPLKVPMLFTF
ncbi:MAG TPA: hypothetical protein VJ970_08160 [Flavobacteriaceae bacterium]|nr:hypothetical protein [Flavobacteriaceae bacterium]